MQQTEQKYTIETCLSPKLFTDILTREDYIVVLTDILRATTSIVTAFRNGVKSIIPVADIELARSWKASGYLVASEQDGKKLDFADFGNSAFSFTREAIGGKTIIYCTTNGTRALEMAKSSGIIAIGAFINLTAMAEWLKHSRKNIVILCSGWKNKFCLEDTLYAGALAEKLMESPSYKICDDSTHAAMSLWKEAKVDLVGYLPKIAHTHRLKKLGLDNVIPYSFQIDTAHVVPVFRGKEIIGIENNETYEK